MRRKWGITHVRQHRLSNKYHKERQIRTLLKKGSIQEEDLTLISIYTPNVGVSKYIKQIKGEIKGGTRRAGDLIERPTQSMDESCRQNISKAREILNNTTRLW